MIARMARFTAFLIGLAGVIATFSCATAQTQPGAPPTLRFQSDEGRNINSFLREGPVAAHLLLRSGTDPRILAAFPAGNSGIGLWFETTAAPVRWTLVTPPRALRSFDEKGRPMYGIEFEAEVSTAVLRPRAAV